MIRTCADDIGMALRRLDELCLIAKLFQDFEATSKPGLETEKETCCANGVQTDEVEP